MILTHVDLLDIFTGVSFASSRGYHDKRIRIVTILVIFHPAEIVICICILLTITFGINS